MAELAVVVAVMEAGKVLLTMREDFEVWCLPGGAVEEGESAAEAALREAEEETGLKVELTRFVGLYSRNGILANHVALFAAKPISGELRTQPGETIAVAYFEQHELPEPLLVGHKRRVQDVFAGSSGLAWKQSNRSNIEGQKDREELYRARDESGLPRAKFYLSLFQPLEAGDEVLQVGSETHVDGR